MFLICETKIYKFILLFVIFVAWFGRVQAKARGQQAYFYFEGPINRLGFVHTIFFSFVRGRVELTRQFSGVR